MTRRATGLALSLLIASQTSLGWAADPAGSGGAKPVDFSREIQPIFAEHCTRCHGPDKAEAGLNLADRGSVLKALESGARAVVPGQAEASELIRRVTSPDAEVRMPPEEEPLTPEQIDTLRRWIAAGAEYQIHWAFRPLVKPKPPAVKNSAGVHSPIDLFVRARLDERKITPSPEADPHTLIKRASLDLTGLLPTPEEVDAFVSAATSKRPASDQDAYVALIDKLLASPHFGERWGRHWLDLARYADSDGYEKDNTRPDAYVYRDWVIDALNRDMPFDRFTIEQLAGDLLPDASPSDKIATAFNRQTLTNTEGGTDQEEFRVAAVFDRTDTLGSVWLGLTVGCAKCHTHKYDPISHTEYYRLFAFFNRADEVTIKLPIKAKDPQSLAAQLRPLEAALEARYLELLPAEQQWEANERKYVESTPSTPLKVESAEIFDVAAQSGAKFTAQKDGSYLVESTPATAAEQPGNEKTAKDQATKEPGDTDVYTVSVGNLPKETTGLRLESIPDPSLPQKGAGRSPSGNFVITQLKAELVDAQGKKIREVPLQRATADFEQTGYKAAEALTTVANSKKGWGVAPDVTKSHYLQVRTFEPITLADGERIKLTVIQHYGGRHTLGRFRVRAVTGDARDLHLPAEVVTALKMYPEKRVYNTRQTLFNFFMNKDEKVRQLLADIDRINSQHQAQLMPVRTIMQARAPRKTARFDRGDFLSPAEEVQPGMLAVLPALKGAAGEPSRLDLARWLVGPSNPLTARVAANQVWAHLFGAGLVRSVGDFGARGETPSHPELLDWLAVTYRDDLRWSLKSLLREIMLSATYRQASAHRPELHDLDPNNTLLARQNRLRVEAELVRDLALQVGGLLSSKIGGPSVFPPMPADLAKLSYANNFSWTDSTGEDRYRRSMYTFFKRTIPHPTLMTFDCPDANVTCVSRSVSNTPLQALTLLNNDSFVESVQALARRLLSETPRDPKITDEQRLAEAVRICLARNPEQDEIERLENLLDQAREYYRDDSEGAEKLIGRYTVATVPNYETAAWVATLRVLVNLDEFITRE